MSYKVTNAHVACQYLLYAGISFGQRGLSAYIDCWIFGHNLQLNWRDSLC